MAGIEPIYNHYIIDVSCNNNFVQNPTMQGDGNGVRGIEIELISNGTQYVINKNEVIAIIAGTKPDTKQILNQCEITEEGYILVDVTSQMSAIKGRGDYCIILIDKNKNSQIKSFPFYIMTTSAPFDIDYIVSDDEFQLLTDIINKALKDYTYIIEKAQKSADAAKISEDNAKTSADNSATSEENAKNYMNEASTSANNSENYSKLSKSWAIGETGVREGEDTNNSKYYAGQSSSSAVKAKQSEDNAKMSEDNAKTSETNAETFMNEASSAAESAKTSEANSKTSEINAKNSEDNAEASETNASISESNASSSATLASDKATEASNSANSASESASVASDKAIEASEYTTSAKSYTHGGTGTRENEDVDNAKYYYEQAKGISEGLNGTLMPMGTITFSQLENQTKLSGYMYNISDEFITTSTFKEGTGFTYPAGTNVYWTADGYWDCLAGTMVAGVKGAAETGYRHGNVDITPENIGLGNVPNVATNDQTPTFTEAAVRENITSGEKLSTLFGKIMKWFSDLKAVAFSGSYNDLSDKPSIPSVVNNNTTTVAGYALDARQANPNIAGSLGAQINAANTALVTHKTSGDHDGRYYTKTEIEEKVGYNSTTVTSAFITTVRVCRQGDGMKRLRLVGAKSSLIAGTAYTVCTLPEEYRPQTGYQAFAVMAASTAAAYFSRVEITTAGVVTLTPYTARAAGESILIDVSYN